MKDSTKNPAPLVKATGTSTGGPSEVKNASGAPSANTKLVGKKNTASGDPARMAKPSRGKTTATGGARYGVRVKMDGGVAPEAGATLANGRLFSAALNRTAPNFQGGVAASHER